MQLFFIYFIKWTKLTLKSIYPFLSISNVLNTWSQNSSALPDGKNILYISTNLAGVNLPFGQSCCKKKWEKKMWKLCQIYKSNSKLYKKLLIKFNFLLHFAKFPSILWRHKISIYQEKLLPPQQTMTNFLYHESEKTFNLFIWINLYRILLFFL